MFRGLLGIGAGDGIRTRDINLGKVALYQLSYSRFVRYFPLSRDGSPAVNSTARLPDVYSFVTGFSCCQRVHFEGTLFYLTH